MIFQNIASFFVHSAIGSPVANNFTTEVPASWHPTTGNDISLLQGCQSSKTPSDGIASSSLS